MRSLPNFLDILNSHARSRGSCHIDWEALTSAFPSLRDEERPTGTARLTMSVHCECSIASHMLRKLPESDFPLEMIRPRHIEIGISKYSCQMCEKYMECLAQTCSSTRFVVSGFQGKIHAGWKPPRDPPSVLSKMAELVRQEADEILETVDRKRRSDSFPRNEEMTAHYKRPEGESWKGWSGGYLDTLDFD